MTTPATARTSATNPGQHVEANRAGSWALVAAAQSGDADAFAQLYDRYAEQITRFLGRRAGSDRGLVEDLTQETFLRAWRRIDTVHDRGRDVGAWLTTIARNLLLDHHKSGRQRYERTFTELPVPRYDDGFEASAEQHVLNQAGRDTEASAERQVLDQLDRHTVASTVRRCLAKLSPDQREVLARFEQPVMTTGAAMGRSEVAVKALRHRAMQAMRQRLASEGVTSSQQCCVAVAGAQQAVRQLRRQSVDLARQTVTQPQPLTQPPAVVDRWAAESVACAVGAEVAL